jgi:hypothetical protein
LKTKKPFLFKLLALIGHYSSFMYYVSDNVLLCVGLLVESGILADDLEHKWKNKKNSFS